VLEDKRKIFNLFPSFARYFYTSLFLLLTPKRFHIQKKNSYWNLFKHMRRFIFIESFAQEKLTLPKHRRFRSVRRTRRRCTKTNGHVTVDEKIVPERARAHPNPARLDRHQPIHIRLCSSVFGYVRRPAISSRAPPFSPSSRSRDLLFWYNFFLFFARAKFPLREQLTAGHHHS